MSTPSKRDYPSSPDVYYILPSDTLEKQRLELQHALVRRALYDGKSVLAPIVLKPGDRVLDSGTGSGAWALSLAEEVPSSVFLTAIDIQSKIFPESFPKNVEFLLYSVTDLPRQWTDKFSLVNQRFLFGALTGQQWKVALQEIYRVIAPGGWVQLVDGVTIPEHIGPFSAKIGNLWSILFAHKGLLVDAVKCLPDMLTQAGFINVL
ncbi:S-adenosyl-L-methionine-dependent methyltransferase, partial [Armillaria luteobubalina]